MSQACNIIKKEILAQVFSCELCEILRTSFFTEHCWVTASDELHNNFSGIKSNYNSALEILFEIWRGQKRSQICTIPRDKNDR